MLNLDRSDYFVGDDLIGSFKVRVVPVSPLAEVDPDLITFRLLGKRSKSDPDSRALFDSGRLIRPLCWITVAPTSTSTLVSGTFQVDGQATARLANLKAPLESGRPDTGAIIIHYALTAFYPNSINGQVLTVGELKLRRDRVKDAAIHEG